MKSVTALANKAYTSILGSLGAGAGPEGNVNFQASSNPAPIAAAQTNTYTGAAFVSKFTGKLLIVGEINVTASAVDDSVGYSLLEDAAPIAGPVQPSIPVGHTTAQGYGIVAWIVSVAIGSSHTFAIAAANATVGHTVATATGGASIIVYELP